MNCPGCSAGNSPVCSGSNTTSPTASSPPTAVPTSLSQTLVADCSRTAPDTFNATFETTNGTFTIATTRAWAPLAADRFYSLLRCGTFDGARFYRVEEYIVQWG